MSRLFKKVLRYVLFFGSGAVLLSDGSPAGLVSCAGRSVQTAINFCFVFDCQNGALGGAIQFCDPNGAGNIFVDCP